MSWAWFRLTCLVIVSFGRMRASVGSAGSFLGRRGFACWRAWKETGALPPAIFGVGGFGI
eukprot:5300778-Pyramimonas_sp.AAC.1